MLQQVRNDNIKLVSAFLSINYIFFSFLKLEEGQMGSVFTSAAPMGNRRPTGSSNQCGTKPMSLPPRPQHLKKRNSYQEK